MTPHSFVGDVTSQYTTAMKSLFALFLLANAISLNAQSKELLYGNWKYEDIHEKEKIDSVGLKALQMFFGEMAFSFGKDGHYQASLMQKKEEGTWAFDANSKKIMLTSTKGKTDEMELIALSETRLVFKAGSGVFIMARY